MISVIGMHGFVNGISLRGSCVCMHMATAEQPDRRGRPVVRLSYDLSMDHSSQGSALIVVPLLQYGQETSYMNSYLHVITR